MEVFGPLAIIVLDRTRAADAVIKGDANSDRQRIERGKERPNPAGDAGPEHSSRIVKIEDNREYGQELWTGVFQAAGFSLMPSMKTTPFTTSDNSGEPFNDRHPFDALSISLNTIVRHAARLPLPLVLSCLSRTVENTDSIGLVVRMWTQCSAGNS